MPALTPLTAAIKITTFKGGDYNIDIGYNCSGAQFCGCSSLKSIKLPSNLTSVTARCFMGTKISKLTLPYGLESIVTRAFEDAKIGQLLIPSSCQRISYSQFIDIKRLDRLIVNVPHSKYAKPSNPDNQYYKDVKSALSKTKVYVPLPSLADYLGEDIFAGVSSLKAGAYDFTVNGGVGGYVTVNGESASPDPSSPTVPLARFEQGPDQTLPFRVSMGLVEDDVYTDKRYNATSLEEYAFANAVNLTHFWYDCELTDIPDCAFENCTSLDGIHSELPQFRPERIGARAFYKSGLKGSVVLPETLTDIGNNAFSFCANLDELVLPYMPSANLWSKTIYATGMNFQFLTLPEDKCHFSSG